MRISSAAAALRDRIRLSPPRVRRSSLSAKRNSRSRAFNRPLGRRQSSHSQALSANSPRLTPGKPRHQVLDQGTLVRLDFPAAEPRRHIAHGRLLSTLRLQGDLSSDTFDTLGMLPVLFCTGNDSEIGWG